MHIYASWIFHSTAITRWMTTLVRVGQQDKKQKNYCNWCISDISTIATLGFIVYDPIGTKELLICLNGHKDFAIDHYCSCISICVSMRIWYANMQYIITFVFCLDNLNKNTDLCWDSSFSPGLAVFFLSRGWILCGFDVVAFSSTMDGHSGTQQGGRWDVWALKKRDPGRLGYIGEYTAQLYMRIIMSHF